MANKRMFSREVIDSDRFYDLPFNSQLLYFHLGMHGDVKGFVEPKRIIRMAGLKVEDLKPLIHEDFVIPFKSGVVVITHWNVNNKVREEREAPTRFIEEYESLSLNNGEYVQLQDNSRSTPAQNRIGENRIGKDSIEERESHTPKYTSLKDINNQLIEQISEDYEVPIEFVLDVKENLELYCGSRGKKYKDYNLTLRNWVKKDKSKYMLEYKRLNKGGKRGIDASNI